MTSAIEKRRSLHLELQEQKARNEQLKKELNGMASLANMGAATAIIAHEINNLLTPLGSYTALALKYPDDHNLVQKALRQAYENSKQACEVISAILTVANGQPQEKKQVNLRKLVDEVFRCICRDFSKDNINIVIDIPEDLTVNAMTAKLQQAIMNLILNARDAMLKKGGILAIKALKFEKNVIIDVKDSGCGIEKKHLSRIFEPFYSTKERSRDNMGNSGSGLGLYLCKKVVDEHGGTISIESEPQLGSAFTITLPET